MTGFISPIKKYVGMCLCMLFCLTGCQLKEPLDIESVNEALEGIKAEYTGIVDAKLYKSLLNDKIIISYTLNEEQTEIPISTCFEDTREWLLDQQMLELIELALQEPVQSIEIHFEGGASCEYYRAQYYRKEGVFYPKRIDGFSKWDHEKKIE